MSATAVQIEIVNNNKNTNNNATMYQRGPGEHNAGGISTHSVETHSLALSGRM